MNNIIPNIYQAIRENGRAERKSRNNFEVLTREKEISYFRNTFYGRQNKVRSKMEFFLGATQNMPYFLETYPGKAEGFVAASRTLKAMEQFLTTDERIRDYKLPPNTIRSNTKTGLNTGPVQFNTNSVDKLFGSIDVNTTKKINFPVGLRGKIPVTFGRKFEKQDYVSINKRELFPQDN